MEEYIQRVRVHLIGDPENVEHRLPVKDIKHVGNEGARSGIAILPDGREVPIYNRVEYGYLWYEQMTYEEWKQQQERGE